MKLRMQEFEQLAKRTGYRNGKWLCRKLGAGKKAHDVLRNGGQIGYGLVKEIHNTFGIGETLRVVDFENETLGGFKSKFICFGGKLY